MTTERQLLDLLHQRLSTSGDGTAMPPRYVLAEHVRTDPTQGGRILDAVAVDTWGSGYYGLHGYEVKISRADWRRELADPTKAQAWAQHCRTFWVIAPPGVVVDDLPYGWGHLTLRGNQLVRKTAAGVNPTPYPLTPATQAGLVRAVSQTAHARALRASQPLDVAQPPTAAPAAPVAMPSTAAGTTAPGSIPGVGTTPVVAAPARAQPQSLPVYWPDTCPVWTCNITAQHTHPERDR